MSRDFGFCARNKSCWERSGRCGRTASAVFAKSHKTVTWDALVTGANKKRTDECINRSQAMHRLSGCRLGPYPPGGRGCTWWGRGSVGDYRSPWLEPLYLKSAWVHHLCTSQRCCSRTSGAGNLFSCRAPGRAASALRIAPLTNQMHAGLITCRQGETFGTLIIKLK